MITKEEFNRILGRNIRKYREKHRWPLRKIVEEIGEGTVSYISALETGKATPNSYTLYKIAKALNVPIQYLCQEQELEDRAIDMSPSDLKLILQQIFDG